MDTESSENPQETLIKIDGCDSNETAEKIKSCLSYYGELLSDITENNVIQLKCQNTNMLYNYTNFTILQ